MLHLESLSKAERHNSYGLRKTQHGLKNEPEFKYVPSI